jgi:hypothetical protein
MSLAKPYRHNNNVLQILMPRARKAALVLMLLVSLSDTVKGASVFQVGSRELGFDVLDTTPIQFFLR